jgi:hypothetical protein
MPMTVQRVELAEWNMLYMIVDQRPQQKTSSLQTPLLFRQILDRQSR